MTISGLPLAMRHYLDVKANLCAQALKSRAASNRARLSPQHEVGFL